MLPMGCFPMYLTLYSTWNTNDYTDIGCLNKFNNLTSYHNSMLRRRLHGLQRRYSWTRIRYADFFDPTIQFITSPTQYGEFFTSISDCHHSKVKSFLLQDSVMGEL
ncbi:hypothetical protein GW17_00032043 [Ensete ventricosum]|nr:hypothetical protein GW17_00032043 [Ensete ventricosum]